MGANNSIRGKDGTIINQLWSVTTDSEGIDRVIGGVKVVSNEYVKRKNDLPIEANTSEAYFKSDANGEIIQLRVFDPITHKAIMDIDIGSSHGDDFPKGLAHIQEYKKGKKGKPKRVKSARLMTDSEVEKWGPLIKLANPKVRFR